LSPPNIDYEHQKIHTLPSLPTPAKLPFPLPLPFPKGEPRRSEIWVIVSLTGSVGRGAATAAVLRANAAIRVLERMLGVCY
jgi:hypothetical protein